MSKLRTVINKAAMKNYTDKTITMKRAGYSVKMISRILSIPESEVIRMTRVWE